MYLYFILGLYVLSTAPRYVHCDGDETANEEVDFKSLRLNGDPDLFIDKSALIQELMAKSSDKATLISRPPKFGKTTNLKMLQRFFEIPRNDDETEINRKLFFGGAVQSSSFRNLNKLEIADNSKIVEQHFGKHPVIYLSFKTCGYSNLFHAMNSIIKRIKFFAAEHEYLEVDIADVTKIKKYSLETLTKYVRKYYKKKVVLLLDDYDSAVSGAYLTHGANSPELNRILAFYAEFMEHNVLYNDNIKRAIITSVTPMFKTLFDLNVYSVMDEKFATYFGFVDQEVTKLLRTSETSKVDDIKAYYKGYNVGGQIIYNPESIIKCVSNSGALDTYWENNDNLKIFDRIQTDSDIIGRLDRLVGHRVNQTVPVRKTFTFSGSWENDLFSYLVYTGYLNAYPVQEVSVGPTECRCTYVNTPARHALRGKIVEWVTKKLKPTRNSYQNELLDCLTQLRIHGFQQELQNVLRKASAVKLFPEAEHYYIDILARLITYPADYYYNVERADHDDERLDVAFVRRSGKASEIAIVIAIQRAPSSDTETLAKTAAQGLREVSEMGYESRLEQTNPEIEYILRASIAFRGQYMDIKSEIGKVDEIKTVSPTTSTTERTSVATTLPTVKPSPRRRTTSTAAPTTIESEEESVAYSSQSTEPSTKSHRKSSPTPEASDSSEQSTHFKIFLRTKLPIISDVSMLELEKHLEASKENRDVFKRFLKSKGVMNDFKQTIYSMWATIIHPDIHIVRRSMGVTRSKDDVADFPKKYRHIIEAVVEVVHHFHNDTGILTLLNAVHEILQHSDVIPVTELESDPKNASVTPHMEVKLITEKPSEAKKQVVGRIRGWIGKIRNAFKNGSKHFHHKLKSLLKGSEVTTAKKPESSESSSGFSSESESDSEY